MLVGLLQELQQHPVPMVLAAAPDHLRQREQAVPGTYPELTRVPGAIVGGAAFSVSIANPAAAL